MLRRRNVGVAYFYEEPNNSTFRYRAYNMAQVLNADPDDDVCASYFFLADREYFDEIADTAEVLVICRSRYCHEISGLVSRFRARGKRVLFDVDDLVFDTDYAHLVMATLGLDLTHPSVWDDWFAMISRMGQTLKMCDGAITTNDFLADRLADFSRLPVHVVPNFMNQEQLGVAGRAYEQKQSSGFANDGKICLGYFSGSPSHRLDYAIVEPALVEVMSQRADVDVTVVGYIETSSSMQKFSDRIHRQPFHDYVNLQRLLARVEFNLMPLQSNAFTDCKSELKYFEAASVGTLSIASPSFTYRRAIRDGENGYLAKAHEWAETILRALDGWSAYNLMAEEARRDALQRFAWQNQRKTILTALGLALRAKGPVPSVVS
ncbi:glycosyltransferase [Variovorax sp. Sphag1AA]|uniref:glycosyltransferase n=1 Tax=Variovorax sp. Sphag1AA TaxID=2587027 RepID=UPI00181CDB7A|nr:glycosyltransferase [Variovorax sp. Sphag1AA]MBB3179815.1 glycosyltransferase involved in cell wall biosynthesis [Variovorax sp. Sphag1AA]